MYRAMLNISFICFLTSVGIGNLSADRKRGYILTLSYITSDVKSRLKVVVVPSIFLIDFINRSVKSWDYYPRACVEFLADTLWRKPCQQMKLRPRVFDFT